MEDNNIGEWAACIVTGSKQVKIGICMHGSYLPNLPIFTHSKIFSCTYGTKQSYLYS